MSSLRNLRDPLEYIRSRIRLNAQYRKVFNTEEGAAVLQHLMVVSGMASESEGLDKERSAYKNGQRDIVLKILRFLERDEASITEELRKIIKEQGDSHG